MSRFRILSENFFDTRQYPNHTISGTTQTVAGHEIWRVGTNRRSPTNYWQPSSTAATYTLRVDCDVSREADTLAMDRVHNLSGETISIQYTSSTAGGWTTANSAIVPSTVSTSRDITNTNGARTYEGAFIFRFNGTTATTAGTKWRVQVSALGGGVRPKVGGLYLGKSWSPNGNSLRPWDDDAVETVGDEQVSPELWSSAGTVAKRRFGSHTVRLSGSTEMAAARHHILDRFWHDEHRYAWLVHRDTEAEKAVFATAPFGRKSMPYPSDWKDRVLTLEWQEHDPKPSF